MLQVTAKDLQRVGEEYLKDGKASVAVVTGKENQDRSKAMNLEIVEI